MDDSVYRQINFDSIVLGTLISADCDGILECSKTEQAFQIKFRTVQNDQFSIILDVPSVKKIFKTHTSNQLVLDFKLKPAAIKDVGEQIKKKDFVYQISKNSDEAKFQLYLNDISDSDVTFVEEFFESIDIFDENVSKVIKEPELPEPHHTPSKIQKPNIFKNRKKKLLDLDPEDGSQDYHPQKRPRKQSLSKITTDCEMIEEAPKRSLRVKNRDEVNLCEEMSEEAQIQEALKRSLKTADQTVIDSISHIEDAKSEQDLEHDEIYDNVDKSIELFTYNTSNGDIIVRMEDYLCLSRNEYLSDVIIDFYLHYIYNVKMTPEMREKTLIIGAHFYTLYATSSEYSGWNDGLNAGLNAKEKRYRRIDGILKQDVNIFEKDYIIMPLMDHSHWFLAIVCFPKLNGSFTIDGNVRVDENDVKRNPKKVFQPAIKSSCILIFDSVKGNGSRRTVAINHIKNFLEYEWINKYQEEFHFDVKCLNGHSPKVPLQMNNVDCGCFILEFMERFFVTSPIDDYRFPIDLADWFSPEEVRSSKRRELAAVIKSMMEAANNQVELPKIRFYGDRKRKSTKSVSFADLENSLENNDNGNTDETFRVQENGHNAILQNGNNGNNNDENFNNNNDFYCLDSNNIVQNNNVIQENQDAVQNIPRNEEYVEAEVERISTQEMMEYEQQCYVEDDGNPDSILLDTSDEMDVDEVTKLTGNDQKVETEKSDENEAKNDSKIENDAEFVIKDPEIEANPEKQVKVVKNDEEIIKSDATTPEICTNGFGNGATIFEESGFVKNDSDVTVIEAQGDKVDANFESEAKSLESDIEILKRDAKALESVAKFSTESKINEEDPKAENHPKFLEIEAIFIKSDGKIEHQEKVLKNDANGAKSDAEMAKVDAEPKNDAEPVINDANSVICDAKPENDANSVKSDAKPENYENPVKIEAKVTETGLKVDAGALEKEDSVQEIQISPVKIDLTLDDSDTDDKVEKEPNNKINIIKNKKKEIESEPEQKNDQVEPINEQENNQKSVTVSIADRISQSIKIKENSIVLLD